MPRSRSNLLFCVALCISASVHATTLEEFRAQPDNRLTIRTSLGLRTVRRVSKDTIEAVFGASVGPAINNPKAYRIVSFSDEHYAFEKFVTPTEARITKVLECTAPQGAPIPRFERTVVTLKIPHQFQFNEDYFLIAQGADGAMVTAAHSAQPILFNKDPIDDDALNAAVLGLRQIESVGQGLLRLEFGPNFSAASANDLANYTITQNGQPITPTAVGRLSRVDTYIPSGAWPMPALPQHDIFLQLPKPLTENDKIEVTVANTITTAANKATCAFNAHTSITNSIKVNQVGYLPDSPVKIAYLGRWLGSFPENPGPALLFPEPPEFHLCSIADNKTVFTAKGKLIHRSGDKNEGVYKIDHSGENVYLLDFTSFKTPGHYYLSIDSVGRSLPFDIADDVYAAAFEIQSAGVFAQRCGIELKPPYSYWHRIDCHDKGLVVTTQIHAEKHDLSVLPTKATDKILHASGGHHDAGDYNPRSHLDVAQKLMDAYEIAPQKFYDGQLNIPESKNGIPDILDEAAWALRLWIGLQDTDGGVYNGTESKGDPNLIQTAELDDQGDYAYAKDAVGSFQFAGTMAQASRLWRSVGKTKEADDFLARARRAYEWANKNPPKTTTALEQHDQFIDPRAYAAAQLLHTTSEAAFNKDFLESAVWSTTPNAEIESHQKYNQSLAAYAYAACDEKITDPKIQTQIKTAITTQADLYIQQSSRMAYAFIRHPWVPINWGTGAYENYLAPIIWAWKFTKDDRYRQWIIRTCDNTLGANPLNLCYITGLGSHSIHAPLHNSRYSHFGEVVPGMQVEGPLQSCDQFNVPQTAFPKLRPDFALLYNFVDANFAITMDEGLVSSQAQTMAIFGLLLPDHKP